jgi:hypothetical protein
MLYALFFEVLEEVKSTMLTPARLGRFRNARKCSSLGVQTTEAFKLEETVIDVEQVGELAKAICRIAAPLTNELALTPPRCGEFLRPIAARLAQTFRGSLVN